MANSSPPSVFWQAKIWGLLHDSPLKPLQRSKSGEGPWDCLSVMQGWQCPGWVKQADYIASASDRAAMGALKGEWAHVNYDDYGSGVQLRHLLAGWQDTNQDFNFHLPPNSILHQWRSLSKADEKDNIKQLVANTIPEEIRDSEDPQEVFWWLWRCLPEALSRCPEINDPRLFLIPAETRIPDCSIWSHNSITAALAGSLMGYDGTEDSRPYIATFTFTPIQEVVKASRKMQDFWAGSWILHYLSACICWAWANEYGPDALVYPSLYAQPLVDHWLLNDKYPESSHSHWHNGSFIQQPGTRRLLTAGFPNVLLIVLPKDKVKGAMDLARRMLTGECSQIESPWLKLADQVKAKIFQTTPIAPSVWEEWLKAQWQIYWTALPLGHTSEVLSRPDNYSEWKGTQNTLVGLAEKNWILTPEEEVFFQQHQINIGSWWAPAFDQIRFALNAVKNARVWELPTAFGSRSTISGIGSVVRKEAKNDWVYSDELDTERADGVNSFWKKQRRLFDGREQLNATEVVKRGIKRIQAKELFGADITQQQRVTYPDLTVGVAGWLKQTQNKDNIQNYQTICSSVLAQCPWMNEAVSEPWGIAWVDEDSERASWSHPRILNAGWIIDDYEPETSDPQKPLTIREQQRQSKEEESRVKSIISQYFSSNNPTNWYVLAAGDGDDMGGWLKGTKMQTYQQYVPTGFPQQSPPTEAEANALNAFLLKDKRMGPATHAALSRALLDFSNQLVPYLTEQRYAGRLIYSGGDDVLAYTNLWEWDNWLWDVRQCFKGDKDPGNEFDDTGDYWRWKKEEKGEPSENLSSRPLFTMGRNASISFGIVIAHHSVPLAIALENLWEAESEAKKHLYVDLQESDPKKQQKKKDAVQVRVMYGNGNILESTTKFDTFDAWRSLLTSIPNLESALFEQAAQLWEQHPVPVQDAISYWVTAFCNRRDFFKGNDSDQLKFTQNLTKFLEGIWAKTQENDRDRQIQNWLKLAAFVLRKRDISIKLPNQED